MKLSAPSNPKKRHHYSHHQSTNKKFSLKQIAAGSVGGGF